MAGRSYSRFTLATWSKPEWRLLTFGAQRLYMLLLSQPTLSAAGCLPRQTRKWAALASDTTVDEIEAALAELAEHRYVLVDDDTEEVLIRTFIKHDGWVKNGRRAKAVESAIARIESPTLRGVTEQAYAEELPKDQGEDTDEEASEGTGDETGEATSEDNCIQQPASSSLDERAAAAAAIAIKYRCAKPGVNNPPGLAAHLRGVLPAQAMAYLAQHPDAPAELVAWRALDGPAPPLSLVHSVDPDVPPCLECIDTPGWVQDPTKDNTSMRCPACSSSRASGGSR